jgi:hypothetical protein
MRTRTRSLARHASKVLAAALLLLPACDSGGDAAPADASGVVQPGEDASGADAGPLDDTTDTGAADDTVTGTPDAAPDVAAPEPDAEQDVTEEDAPPAIDPTAASTYEPLPEELAAYPMCTAEQLTLTVHGNKVAALELGNGGYEGQGLDVDGDAATCAPADDCGDGVDNQLGVLGALVNGSLVDSLDSGVIMLVLEFEEFAVNGYGNPFTLKMFTASLDATDMDCDFQKEECVFNVRADSFDESCNPLMTFDNATITADGALLAGGPSSKFDLSIPLFGLTVKVPVYAARLEAQATVEKGIVYGMEGLIGGAVPKTELLAAIETIPDKEFEAAGYSKSFIVSTADSIIEDDIDSDGDGTSDGASIGIRFRTIPGKLAGFEIPSTP